MVPTKTLKLSGVGYNEIEPFLLKAALFREPELQLIAVISETIKNGQHFVLKLNDETVFGYSLVVVDDDVWIMQAAGKAKFDLTDIGLKIIELQSVGYRSVNFRTVRRGLWRKAKKYGYEQQGTIFRKWLT